jgi:spoIIIJ-associated protein
VTEKTIKAPIEAEGDTIDEAIAGALAELGVAREEARVEILSDSRRGLLGFGGQRARVRVSLRKTENEATSAAAAGSPPATRSVPAAEADGSKGPAIVATILELMDFPATLVTEPRAEGGVAIRIESEHGGLLIGKHGQTLDSLEYLVNRLVGRDDEGGHVVLDTENYRERRKASLEQMARSLAERAKKRGRPETLVPMSARDRRIVHLALQADSAVTTKSLGEGHLRRVVISPTGGRTRDRNGDSRSPRP